MLLQLSIQDFAIVRSLEIDWQQGMTTITGETGAGKSIAIDALGLCLGDRATTNVVRPNSKKADLTATFDIQKNKAAKKWLKSHELLADDDCLMRRVVSAEGRSKAYINGIQVPLAQLKELGQKLINIHGQHDHQLITKATEQRKIIDDYANHADLLTNVKHYHQQYLSLQTEYNQLKENKAQREAQKQLLQYQVTELDEFAIQQGEFESLEKDYNRFSNAQDILNESLQALHILSEDEHFNITDKLRQVSEQISQLSQLDPALAAISNTLMESMIQIEDASKELQHYHQQLELDPNAYNLIEERFSTAVMLAKKHKVLPEKLYQLHQSLNQELTSMSEDESRLSAINEEIDQTWQFYLDAATKLSESRKHSAEKLNKLITASMRELNMPNGEFKIDITKVEQEKTSAHGFDDVNYLVSMNPGQPLEALNKVASGGELSRISLAMQVILAKNVVTPSLIFDEVDVGISGPTAAMVGKKLNQLAKKTQVICVTHLPQVACKGDQQLFVAKLTDGEHTETTVRELSAESRVKEIARLLAGDKITENSLANAAELLAS